MHARGQIWLNAAPRTVWLAVAEPDVLRRCVPGCRRVERVGPHDYRLELGGAWGPLRVAFAVRVAIQATAPAPADPDGSMRFRLSARGQGKLGRADGCADVALIPRANGTLLAYTANGTPDAALARLGQPVLQQVIGVLSPRLFARFADVVNGRAHPAPTRVQPAESRAPAL